MAIAAQLVIELFYFVVFETLWRGRSPGKRLLGLGVVSEDGLPVSFGASLVRNLLRSADILPSSYTTGLVTMLVSKRTQRLGDIAAGTVVVRFDRPRPAAPLDEGSDEEAHGVHVTGPIDHEGVWLSIYFGDPNGITLELTHQSRALTETDAAHAASAERCCARRCAGSTRCPPIGRRKWRPARRARCRRGSGPASWSPARRAPIFGRCTAGSGQGAAKQEA